MQSDLKRRDFIKLVGIGAVSLAAPKCRNSFAQNSKPQPLNLPNIILCMTDDQGWGDTGYNGHPHLKTPNLDKMSKAGIRFDRWYTGAPVCSPTRGACITGRHPYRYGIFKANVGRMKPQEITLAEALKTKGYTTGHFGKWHMGTLTTKIKDGKRGGPGSENEFSPPWLNGYDQCFCTEQAVPTWNPMENQGPKTRYWTGQDTFVPTDDPSLKGDDSRVIMDRAIPFIQNAVQSDTPFLAVIWFHTPHGPVVAGPEYRKMYSQFSEKSQHYYGCLTAMDEQMGRLRAELNNLGIEDNTMLWFSSDNGPAGGQPGITGQGEDKLRGGKWSLYEGGVRVPGMLIWPEKIKTPKTVDMACSVLDYFPTILDYLDFKMPDQPTPIDGVSFKPLIEGKMEQRPTPLGFQFKTQSSLVTNQYKLISTDSGSTYELYDLIKDKQEKNNIASTNPEVVKSMKSTLLSWIDSCKNSNNGNDY